MKDFKPLQKVVFSLKRLRIPFDVYQAITPSAVFPPEGEIVTIVRSNPNRAGFWMIREYLTDRRGRLQSISDLVLFPVEEYGNRLTDEMLSGITKKLHPVKTPLYDYPAI
jgi:hypothetical protein